MGFCISTITVQMVVVVVPLRSPLLAGSSRNGLQLVCGADCSCKLDCRASPGDLEGSRD